MTDERTKELDNALTFIKERIQHYEDGFITGHELHIILVDHLTNIDLKPLKELHDEQTDE